MDYGLLIIIILLVFYAGYKDYIHAKHLERLELRLKGLEPTELDSTQPNEPTNSISNEKYVDLSMADPSVLAESLAKAARHQDNI